MHRPLAIAVALLPCLALEPLASAPLAAQTAGLVLEVHGGGAVPMGDFANGSDAGEGTSPGASFSLAFVRPGDGRRSFYVGFSQHRFGCEDAGCLPDGRYVATGFDLGARIALVTGRRAIPWIRLGAVTTRVETDDLGGADAGVSDLGFGGEIGAGVHIGAESTLALNPGVRFAAVNTDLPGGSTLAMRYLIAQLAVAVSF